MRSAKRSSMCAPELLEERVGLGQVLAVRALALVEVRDGVEAQPVDAQLEPEVDRPQERLLDRGLSKLRSGWWE